MKLIKQAWPGGVGQKDKRWLTMEALADVDAGRVIDHRAVQAWADSLVTAGPMPTPRQ